MIPSQEILIVDDDPAVRTAYQRFLETATSIDAGLAAAHRVLRDSGVATAPPPLMVTMVDGGEAAIEAMRARLAEGRTFALAIIDLQVPEGLDELDTAERLWDLDPDLQVVVASGRIGCTWDAVTARFGRTDRLLFLKKPFDVVEAQQLVFALSRKRELLDGLRQRERELERRVAERTSELSAAVEAAQAAARAKMEFLANMSHEIRTPLTAILGFTELLRDPGLTDHQRREYLDIIDRNGDHLLTLINGVLDISKLEADQLLIECLPTDLPTLLSEIASLMRKRAAEKGLQLRLVYDGPCPQRILTDPTRLRQILLNLIGNAVKFTEQGQVTLRVRVEQRDEGADLHLAVEDTGIGIDAERIAKLFQPFVQADSSTSRRFGGTGLGLSISRRLAALMGGGITVRSVPGKGTAFTLTLPTTPEAGTPVHPNLSESVIAESRRRMALQVRPLRGRILLAEDGIYNQRLLATILRKAGAEVEIANTGLEAVDRVLAALAGGQPFDLVLMDMQMPVLDGYAATRQLRAAGWAGPIVALTAHAMEGDRERCIDEGCDGYETKPVRADRLVATCAIFLAR